MTQTLRDEICIEESELLMKNFILTFAFMVVAGWIMWGFAGDAAMAAVPTHKAKQLTADPELESATDTSVIIRWTSINPGGTSLHYGVVHYGSDAKNLTQVAQSPNRRNPSHPDMLFRVRIIGLNSKTTYYYKVESTGAAGASDEVSSSVKTFKTQ
jgi:phosphodiesterase/alkaline phosphatase D-like protein